MPLPDIDSFATLGGAKQNYAPVEDVTTDLDADQDNISRADVAAMTHTAIRAWAKVTLAATTGAMTLVAHDALWGNLPAVAPTPAHSATGIFTLTFPTSIVDELGNTISVNVRGAWVNVRGSTFYHATTEVTSANVLTVRVYDTSHAANDAVGVTIDIFAI